MAAYNIAGELICSRLGLTPSSDARRSSRLNGQIPLPKNTLENLKKVNGNLEYIIIDEFSMICNFYISKDSFTSYF